MIPTKENVEIVAQARVGAIRARARELGDVDSDDERLIGIVFRSAMHYAERAHHPAPTAQAAVAWAIADMHTIDVPIIDDETEPGS